MTFEPEVITSGFESGLIKAVKQHVCSFFFLILKSTFLSQLFPVSHVSAYRMLLSFYTEHSSEDSEARNINCLQRWRKSLLWLCWVTRWAVRVYFETFWMETISIGLWNVFDLKTRTNNNAEGKTLFPSSLPHHTRRSFTQVGTIDSLIVSTKASQHMAFYSCFQKEEEIRFNQNTQHVRMVRKRYTDSKHVACKNDPII
jgi:hypothetical protein